MWRSNANFLAQFYDIKSIYQCVTFQLSLFQNFDTNVSELKPLLVVIQHQQLVCFFLKIYIEISEAIFFFNCITSKKNYPSQRTLHFIVHLLCYATCALACQIVSLKGFQTWILMSISCFPLRTKCFDWKNRPVEVIYYYYLLLLLLLLSTQLLNRRLWLLSYILYQ